MNYNRNYIFQSQHYKLENISFKIIIHSLNALIIITEYSPTDQSSSNEENASLMEISEGQSSGTNSHIEMSQTSNLQENGLDLRKELEETKKAVQEVRDALIAQGKDKGM